MPASPTIAQHPRCTATRRDGQPCAAPALPGERFCFVHHPGRAEEQRAGREKGGRGKATAARAGKMVPAVLRPVLDTLLAALDETKAGTLDPRRATALGGLARAIVAVYQVGALEERVAALEAAHAAQGGEEEGWR